jgi:hypothetical protein
MFQKIEKKTTKALVFFNNKIIFFASTGISSTDIFPVVVVVRAFFSYLTNVSSRDLKRTESNPN